MGIDSERLDAAGIVAGGQGRSDSEILAGGIMGLWWLAGVSVLLCIVLIACSGCSMAQGEVLPTPPRLGR